jgi:hypothetical protein
MRALLLSLLFAACATSARAQDAMAPFAPLLGCWRGVFEGNKAIRDERCFEPMLGGRYVRDTHFVRPTTYGGETIYFVDAQNGTLSFTYYASDGGMSSGSVRAEPGALVFDAHDYVGADGATQRLRSRWAIDAPHRFVVVSEREVDGVWRSWGRISYTRVR